MNFTESFDQFSSRVSTLDLALYAGVGLVLWVLFKDKLSPVQTFLNSLLSNIKSFNSHTVDNNPISVSVPVVNNTTSTEEISIPRFAVIDDVFLRLIMSWKQTRDLAVESGCEEAVKAADQMFPFLSPNVCQKEDSKNKVIS